MRRGVAIDSEGSAAARLGAGGAALRLPGEALRRARPRWWLELLTVAWLAWVYDLTTNLAPLRLHAALAHGSSLLSLEGSLGIDPERSLDRWLSGHHTLGLIVSDYYDNAHFIFTITLLVWLWWRRSDVYRPLRSSLVLVNVLAFVVFWRYPVAPPRMLAGFRDVVADTHAIGSWHTGSLASHANELAAMPSLHIAWALWFVVALWKVTRLRVVRALAVLHLLLTTAAVLATGNHYVLDVVAGALAMALAFGLVAVAPRVRAALPAKPARAPG